MIRSVMEAYAWYKYLGDSWKFMLGMVGKCNILVVIVTVYRKYKTSTQ